LIGGPGATVKAGDGFAVCRGFHLEVAAIISFKDKGTAYVMGGIHPGTCLLGIDGVNDHIVTIS
jgi:hypothetical protein